MKKINLFIVITAFNLSSVYSQDPRFTQSYAAPLQMNPALMSPNADLKAILNYRRQWNNIQNGFITYRFTFLYPLIINNEGRKLNFGLSGFKDKAGAFNTTDIAASTSYSLRLSGSNHYLGGSLIIGAIQQSLDASQLSFDDQYVLGAYDANNPSFNKVSNENVIYPDVGAGALWYYTPYDSGSFINIYAGFSAFHMNKPAFAFIQNQQSSVSERYLFLGGVKIKTNKKFDFLPNIIISSQDGAGENAAGFYTGYNFNETMKLALGAWYRFRKNDAIALSIGFDHRMFMIAYSYDMPSVAMNNIISGQFTHEFTVAYKINRALKKGFGIIPAPFYAF